MNNLYYLSFGQSHAHSVSGKTFDKDCICVIAADTEAHARRIAVEAFGAKWSNLYEEKPNMDYFPRGLMEL